ncbi:hypothetical protein DFP72DRAFT_1071287 [Ephemerocybe angulata]|uniref:Uncharacterized protein n=1 Tax=Ephemerocybe angulata TaxID=980116 RepID=A0A8H6HR14_9AGAR|nr:hypothetical protein DFP72DRAFT_1071287 [Tulosesus angulatus]
MWEVLVLLQIEHQEDQDPETVPYIRYMEELLQDKSDEDSADEAGDQKHTTPLCICVCMIPESSQAFAKAHYLQSNISFKCFAGFLEFELRGIDESASVARVYCHIYVTRQNVKTHKHIFKTISDIVCHDTGGDWKWIHLQHNRKMSSLGHAFSMLTSMVGRLKNIQKTAAPEHVKQHMCSLLTRPVFREVDSSPQVTGATAPAQSAQSTIPSAAQQELCDAFEAKCAELQEAWDAKSDKAAGWIWLTLEQDQKMLVDGCRDDPKAMWTTLEGTYRQNRAGSRFNAYDDLFSIQKQEEKTLQTLINRVDEAMKLFQTLRPKEFDLSALDKELASMVHPSPP